MAGVAGKAEMVGVAGKAGIVGIAGIAGVVGMEERLCLSSLSSLHKTSVWNLSSNLSNVNSCSCILNS